MTVRYLALFMLAAFVLTPVSLPPALAQDTLSERTMKFGDLPDSEDAVHYSSPEGEFSVTFPAGCAQLYTKMNGKPGESVAADVRLVIVNCERDRANHEGCQVHARLGVARELTGQAATDLVLADVRKLMDAYGVVPGRQRPLHADFGAHGVVEGIEVMAHQQSGAGEVWIRGLLRGDDVYVQLAWKANGSLTEDPAYGVFFESFRPWAE